MLPAAFAPFVNDAPFCVMARATLESLFSAERLDQLFRATAEKQYTRELLFSQLVELMTAVVLQQQPSVFAAYRKGVGGITVSDQSVSNKLDGMELGVSAALVRDSAARLEPVIDELNARHESWLAGYRVRILDGNHLSATERRLTELRDAWDSPLPGKVLAVLDQQTDLATHAFLTPDGHAQERSLLDDVLAVVAAQFLPALALVAPKSLFPKFSAVAYRCKAFRPKLFKDWLEEANVGALQATWLNESERVLFFITRSESRVSWSRTKALRERTWDLYVLYYTGPGRFWHNGRTASAGLNYEVDGGYQPPREYSPCVRCRSRPTICGPSPLTAITTPTPASSRRWKSWG